ELGEEAEARLVGHERGPTLGVLATRQRVEARVDLDQVERAGQERERMETMRLVRRVHATIPVGIGPARRTDANRRRDRGAAHSSGSTPSSSNPRRSLASMDSPIATLSASSSRFVASRGIVIGFPNTNASRAKGLGI